MTDVGQQSGKVQRRRRLAVVIVHYKTPALLHDCIQTLLPEIDATRDEIIIIDAASGEEHLAPIRDLRNHPGVTLIESDKNLGFAGGNNIGLRHLLHTGGADYYMLLNPDTLARPGAFATLLAYIETHPEAALVGPRLEYPDATPQVSAFGDQRPLSELIRGASIGPITKLFQRWEVYGQIRNEPHAADWLSGACVLMRSEVLEKVGLLDDGYFMYYEEVDYFRRARRAGFHAWHVPAARVVHLVGQASGITKDLSAKRLPAYWFESRHRYFRKHFGYTGMALADAAYIAGCALNRIRRVCTGVSHSAAAKGEIADFLRHSVRQLRHLGPLPSR